jgi:hypothetical protein
MALRFQNNRVATRSLGAIKIPTLNPVRFGSRIRDHGSSAGCFGGAAG